MFNSPLDGDGRSPRCWEGTDLENNPLLTLELVCDYADYYDPYTDTPWADEFEVDEFFTFNS